LPPERALFLAFALLAAGRAAAADFDGLALGATESAVKARLPSAHCQPLQWESRAADRRCDDSRAVVDKTEVGITVYFKADAVQAFDLRFESRYAARFAKLTSERFGAAPVERETEKAHLRQWRSGAEQALLTSDPGERRASLLVWRGSFNDEIYKVR